MNDSPKGAEKIRRQRRLSAALRENGPTVIETVVDSEHYVDTVYD